MTQCPACQTLLPDPPERFCPSCGHDLQTAAAAPEAPPPPAWTPPPPAWTPPPPAGGGDGGGGSWSTPPHSGGGTPWERRDQIGLATALVETTQGVLLRPGDFFRAMPVVGGLGGPIFYGVIVGYIGVAAKAVYDLVFSSVLSSAFTSMARDPQLAPLVPLLQAGGGIVQFLLTLVFGIPLIIIGMFITAGIFHLVLLLLGGASRGFEATLRVVAYAEAAQLLNVIPMCGGLLGSVYMMVLCAIGLKEAHQTTMGKAIMAVVFPILLVCCCCAAFFGIFFTSIMAMLGHAR